jgi:hypothetical protein
MSYGSSSAILDAPGRNGVVSKGAPAAMSAVKEARPEAWRVEQACFQGARLTSIPRVTLLFVEAWIHMQSPWLEQMSQQQIVNPPILSEGRPSPGGRPCPCHDPRGGPWHAGAPATPLHGLPPLQCRCV